jgi:putative endonuclease
MGWSIAKNQFIKKYYIYILDCSDGNFYVGMTSKLISQIYNHITGHGAEYTQRHLPCNLVHLETCGDYLSSCDIETYRRMSLRDGWRDFSLPEEFEDFFYRIAAMATRDDKDLLLPLEYSVDTKISCIQLIKIPFVPGW